MKRLLTLTTLLILTACTAATIEPITPTAVPTNTPLPTPIPGPTLTLTPQYSPTPAPIPTPLFPVSLVADGLLLSTGASPTCELPCWHDLRIGISTQADVERVFTELLDAEEGFDFFADPVYSLTNYDIEGVYAGGHKWSIEESESGPLGTYYIHAFMDEETGLLSGFTERINPYRMYEAPTLPEVVERLGKPDWVYGLYEAPGFTGTLIYEQGIRIQLFIPYNRVVDMNTALFCFNDQPQDGIYTLVEPYVSLDREDWSPLKKTMQIPWDPAPFIDERLGMSSIDEFIEFVTSDNPCIEVPR